MEAQEAARRAADAAAAARAAAAAAAATAANEEQEQQHQQQQRQSHGAEARLPETAVPGLVPEGAHQPDLLPARMRPTTVGRTLDEIRQLRGEAMRRQIQQVPYLPESSRRVQFSPPPELPTATFPALYRVVWESGARVVDDDGIPVRTVPMGRVVLCRGFAWHGGGRGRGASVRIPDGWVSEDAVVRVHTIRTISR